METTDNTLNEMQQQMQLLKDKLSKQTIVNEQMMRNAFGKGIKDPGQITASRPLPQLQECLAVRHSTIWDARCTL